jgi:hypothetical protein
MPCSTWSGPGWTRPRNVDVVAADFNEQLTGIRAAFYNLTDAVAALPDRDAAYRHATDLVDQLDSLVSAAAVVRARMADRIRASEGLSVAELGERLGVSKGRAYQFMLIARDEAES